MVRDTPVPVRWVRACLEQLGAELLRFLIPIYDLFCVSFIKAFANTLVWCETVSQDVNACKGVGNEHVKKPESKQSEGRSKKRDRGIVRRTAEVLAYNGVMTRGELEEISKGSSVGRQMLSFLKRCKLVYETRAGYILSVPWLLYFYKRDRDRWVEYVRKLIPKLQDEEVRELRKVIEETVGTPLEKFVDAHISIATELESLALIPVKYMPEKCDMDRCFRQVLKYSVWLLTVIADLLELYAKGVKFHEIISWLEGLSIQSRKLLPEIQELRDLEEHPLGFYMKLLTETADALQRVVRNLLYAYGRFRGDIAEKAVEWAIQKYREAVGVDRAKRGEWRAMYYSRLFLKELSRAVVLDVALRIALST